MNGFMLSVLTFYDTLANKTTSLKANAFLCNYPLVLSTASSFKITINDCTPGSKEVK
jgi:hypothetical protein